jgi:(R,R)-butanediol dehydrogenase / meso-butanediol dehydrogenase / diacetyl reductase
MNMKMKAARLHGAGDVRLDEVDAPTAPGPGEVLLQIASVGICGSDGLEYRAGPVLAHLDGQPHRVTGHAGPVTLGHEFAGVVVEVGAGVEQLAEGMLVACGAAMSCGACGACRVGRTQLCARYATLGFHRDGGLAELCLAPAEICFDAGPFGLSADGAALVQPMAIAVHAARRGRVGEGDTVVVIGAGAIGCFLTHACVDWGARVIVSELDDRRLAVARALGATRTVVAIGTELAQALHDDGLVPDVIFEVTGAAGALQEAIGLAPRGGRIVAVGVQKTAPPVDMRRVTLDELELIGTVAHTGRDDVAEALRLVAARAGGWADVAPDVLPLADLLDEGLRPMAEGRGTRIKTLFDPSATARRPSRTRRDAAGA